MRINKINQQTFQGHKYLTQDHIESLYRLEKLMDKDTTYNMKNEFVLIKTSTRGLTNKSNKKDSFLRYMVGNEVSLTVEKTTIIANSNNGKILEHNKPFYKSWNKIFREIGRALSEFLNNYSNNDIIQKNKFSVTSVTKDVIKPFRHQIK